MTQVSTLRPWDRIPAEEQTALLVEYGYFLDSLPPTCSLETKEQRFRSWLGERGIVYSRPSDRTTVQTKTAPPGGGETHS